MFGAPKVKDLTPEELKAGLDAGAMVLIDVREPAEFAAEHILGAVNYPLSSFDPDGLPPSHGRLLVLQCGSGKRSGTAAGRCRKAGQAVEWHLGGGIMAWKAAGLPTVAGRDA